MHDFPAGAWVAISLVGLSAFTGMLYVLATLARNETYIHEARIKVVSLRARYAKLAEESAEAAAHDDIIILPDPVPAPPPETQTQSQRRSAA